MIARRTVLASGATLGAIGLSGCSHRSEKTTPVHPTVAGTTPRVDTAAQRRDAVSHEAFLAQLATKAANSVSGGRKATYEQLAAAHRRHEQVLSQTDPFSGKTDSLTPSVSPTPLAAGQGSPDALLQHHEKAAAARYLSNCRAAGDPSQSLLWASLSVFCSAFAPDAPAPRPRPKVVPVTVGQEPLVHAQQALLTHLNALMAGLEWGIGRLEEDDPLRTWGQQRRDQVIAQRAEVRQGLREASATPTPDLPGYPMPTAPANPAATRSLWSGLEDNVLSGWGRVVAASPSSARSHAVAAMITQAEVLAHLGTGVTTWPGWV
ncbi:DUF4439 domain-containing protein [Cutibacterium equinum]|uniref:DUF4439 domain-containing protein n=1 Tax=Cutibacterium equinum TaxID=3016342 RepID=A0ABY7QW02_9ACTN|nr:DUF4439 domain-containing protein [Cutibacterium equinum]WCC79251.1 DUF4439 domain-containing protein [Cutibacterium equinum]